jgi:predicted extracellular nuclease
MIRARWLMMGLLLAEVCTAQAAGDVVISQVYGGGGNSGAPLQNDFIELFNRSASPVSLSGWSVQYASATGTGNFSANGVIALSGMLQPGQYYLVQLAGGAVGAPLPAPDASGTSPNLSGTSGKVVLVNTTAGLACNGGSAPCSAEQLAQIVDLVGYGGANFFENAPTAALSNSTAALRANGGCTDTDVNNADFTTGAPTPRNTASPLSPCGGPVNAPVVAACPASLPVVLGVGGTANLSANDADGVVSTAAISSVAVAGISLDNVVPGNPLTAQLQVSADTAAGNYPVMVTFSNTDTPAQTASCTVNVNVAPPAVVARIHDIQGAAHLSPRNGQAVSAVPGIVTAVRSNGFNLQDPVPDANPATSEAIFVFTSSAPTVSVGDAVQVNGTVSEFRPGGSDGRTNLTTTEIINPVVMVLSSGNALPPAVVLGAGGRVIPSAVIDDDAAGDVETSGSFDVATDAIDFFESLEAMRVRINNAVAVGPSNSFGEVPVLADNGAVSTLRTPRGGIVINSTDFNPERLILDDVILSTPSVNVGDGLSTVTAVVDYSFGNWKFDVTEPVTAIDNGLTAEVSGLVSTPSKLTIGSYNVENLAPGNPPAKFAALAGQIVNGLRAPDIVALMELQDNNGATDNGVVDATTTFNMLIAAIQAAGGPAYQFRSINPVNDEDGGEPGGNIRVGFLFNPARVSFVDRAGGGPLVATTVVSTSSGPRLSVSPGRIDPANTAFANSRKPLVGEFLFNGRKLFVIANHFNSKGGDDPLFGHLQPPTRSSEVQRHQQANVVNGFVKSILAADSNASVVVLGDLNDFEFSETLTLLKAGGALVDLVDTLPPSERYTYVFDGNSQVLDHILVSNALAQFAQPKVDIVHMNAEFAAQVSDHDPDVVRLRLHKAGDVDGDGDIDIVDVIAIAAALNSKANGPYDPRNMNADKRIDAVDLRLAINALKRR